MHARLSEVHLNFIVHALNDEEDEERGGNGGRDKDRKQRPRRVTEDFLPMHYTLVRPNTQTFLLSLIPLSLSPHFHLSCEPSLFDYLSI